LSSALHQTDTPQAGSNSKRARGSDFRTESNDIAVGRTHFDALLASSEQAQPLRRAPSRSHDRGNDAESSPPHRQALPRCAAPLRRLPPSPMTPASAASDGHLRSPPLSPSNGLLRFTQCPAAGSPRGRTAELLQIADINRTKFSFVPMRQVLQFSVRPAGAACLPLRCICAGPLPLLHGDVDGSGQAASTKSRENFPPRSFLKSRPRAWPAELLTSSWTVDLGVKALEVFSPSKTQVFAFFSTHSVPN
jgi:hypothetical protein